MFGVSACVNVSFEHTRQGHSFLLFVRQFSLFSTKREAVPGFSANESRDQRPIVAVQS